MEGDVHRDPRHPGRLRPHRPLGLPHDTARGHPVQRTQNLLQGLRGEQAEWTQVQRNMDFRYVRLARPTRLHTYGRFVFKNKFM